MQVIEQNLKAKYESLNRVDKAFIAVFAFLSVSTVALFVLWLLAL
jgi:hypothetical protein